MDNLKITDLIDIEALQRIQDGFSKYTGMAAITIDVDGSPITRESGFTRFCNGLTRKSELGCKNCEKCDRDGAFRTLETGQTTAYVCHAGLMDFAAPIMVEGQMLGGFIGGQVRMEETNDELIVEKAKEYGIDPEEYVKASKETGLLTREQVEKAAKFLEELASGLSLMAYKSYLELQESEHMGRVAKSQADYIMNMTMNLGHVMEKWISIIDSNKDRTGDEDIRNMLTAMRTDGKDIQTSIKDSIDFIKISANNVEVSESPYSLTQLKNMVAENMSDKSRIVVAEAEYENLFGDVVRIGQILTKTILGISGTEQEPEVKLSTERKQYATSLNVEIIDRKTNRTDSEVEKVRSFFYSEGDIELDDQDESGTWLSFEGMLLRQMFGSAEINKIGEDLVIRISIPQIGLGAE